MSEPAPETPEQPEVTASDLNTATRDAQAEEAKRRAEVTKPDEPDEAFDKDRAMATITKQRDEVKALKARAKEAEDKAAKFDQLEAEKLSEQEKLAKRAEEAEQKVAQAQQKLRRANLVAELSKPEHGIVNASAAAKLIEGVEYRDDDTPTNLGELLPDFLEQNTYLRGQAALGQASTAKVDGGVGRTTGPAPALTADELEVAKQRGMSPDYYAALKDVNNVEEFEAVRRKYADVP